MRRMSAANALCAPSSATINLSVPGSVPAMMMLTSVGSPSQGPVAQPAASPATPEPSAAEMLKLMQSMASQVAALTERLNATEIRNEELSSKLPVEKGDEAQGSGVKLITKTSQVPVRGTTESAGFDVKADEGVTIPVGCRRAISIGMTLRPQVGHYMHVPTTIWPCS